MKTRNIWTTGVISLGLIGTASTLSFAQQDASLPEITIRAGATYTVEKLGPSSTMKGAPQEQVTVARQVSYSDLDLGTGEGVTQLRKRIGDAAVASCNELKVLARLHTSEPPASGSNCVNEAMDSAKAQVDAAIAAGEKAHHEQHQ